MTSANTPDDSTIEPDQIQVNTNQDDIIESTQSTEETIEEKEEVSADAFTYPDDEINKILGDDVISVENAHIDPLIDIDMVDGFNASIGEPLPLGSEAGMAGAAPRVTTMQGMQLAMVALLIWIKYGS